MGLTAHCTGAEASPWYSLLGNPSARAECEVRASTSSTAMARPLHF